MKGEVHRTDELVYKIIVKILGPITTAGLAMMTAEQFLPGSFFSAMGFYPDCLATDYYTIGYPLFYKIIIKLNTDYYKGDSVTIEKQPRVNNQIYFNGSEIENNRLYHNLIVEGGTLLIK